MSLVLGLDPAIATLGFALLERDGDGAVNLIDAGVWLTPSDASIPARLSELAADVSGYFRHVEALAADIGDPRLPGRIDTLVVETPTFLRDASASSKLWASFGMLMGLSQGRLWVERSTTMWRTALGLPTERSLAPRGADAKVKAKASREAKARRKASTEAWVRNRFRPAMLNPIIDRIPRHLGRDLAEHAFDAIAIASSWTDNRRKHAAEPTPGLEA